MVIYGSRSKFLTAQELDGVTCESCGQTGMVAHIFQKYFHFFWIPVFPYKKVVTTECSRCQQALTDEEIPIMYVPPLEKLRGSVKTPWYMFTGLVLILLLAGGKFYVDQQNQEQQAAYVANPQVGDLYVIHVQKVLRVKEDAGYPFGVLKITNVADKKVTLTFGNYEYSAEQGALEDIDKGKVDELKNFYQATSTLSRSNNCRPCAGKVTFATSPGGASKRPPKGEKFCDELPFRSNGAKYNALEIFAFATKP